jgi:protein SCO1/2
MHGLLEALQASGLPRTDWRIVGVSIDPSDTPADAHRRHELDRAYASFLAGSGGAQRELRLDLLVGTAPQVQRVTRAIGYRFEPIQVPAGAPPQFAHPATVIVATPDGHVSRYFNGVQFDPAELRSALVEASGGAVGSVTDRLALLCAHFNPAIGRFSGGVMLTTRIVGALTIAMLALVAWRKRGRQR